jgi:hypothetical protein
MSTPRTASIVSFFDTKCLVNLRVWITAPVSPLAPAGRESRRHHRQIAATRD